VQISKIETSTTQLANCSLLYAYLRRTRLQLWLAARTQKNLISLICWAVLIVFWLQIKNNLGWISFKSYIYFL